MGTTLFECKIEISKLKENLVISNGITTNSIHKNEL